MQNNYADLFGKAAVFSWVNLLTTIVYGGVVEEILLRWCVLSLLAWMLSAIGIRQSLAIGLAIVVSSFLFGIGHVPATYHLFTNPPIEMTIRVVVLNSIAGLAFGVAYMRNSLEAAMLCHACTHIGLLASSTTMF